MSESPAVFPQTKDRERVIVDARSWQNRPEASAEQTGVALVDQRTRELLREELRKVAPGTRLREGLDMVLAAGTGALVVIGDEVAMNDLCNGGFRIDTPFSPQRLFELAKMDGAIVLDQDVEHILRANVHLVPDASLPTSETGMRHRTAERVSRQTQALVISVSQRREVVSLYRRGRRLTLENIEVVLTKANQALATLQNYRTRLDEVLEHLTHLEFDDSVTLGDIAEAIGRFEMLQRVATEVDRYIVQLGTEGRLVQMQADELSASVSEQYILIIRDYAAETSLRFASTVTARLSDLPLERLLEPEAVAHELGLAASDRAEHHLRSRGYRVLAQIPALPATVVGRIVERFHSLPALVAASVDDLDEVDGVGMRRARFIVNGLSRIRSHVSL